MEQWDNESTLMQEDVQVKNGKLYLCKYNTEEKNNQEQYYHLVDSEYIIKK